MKENLIVTEAISDGRDPCKVQSRQTSTQKKFSLSFGSFDKASAADYEKFWKRQFFEKHIGFKMYKVFRFVSCSVSDNIFFRFSIERCFEHLTFFGSISVTVSYKNSENLEIIGVNKILHWAVQFSMLISNVILLSHEN